MAEARARRRAAHQPRRRIGEQAADHQHDHGDDQVRQPQQELAQHVRHGRQSERIEGDDQHDQLHEPVRHHGEEAGAVLLHADIAHEVAEARAIGEIVEVHRAQQARRELGDQPGHEPADDQDHRERDHFGNRGKEHGEAAGQRRQHRLGPVTYGREHVYLLNEKGFRYNSASTIPACETAQALQCQVGRLC